MGGWGWPLHSAEIAVIGIRAGLKVKVRKEEKTESSMEERALVPRRGPSLEKKERFFVSE